MRIGELAKLTGASPKAIRLYEQQGLLPHVHRAGTYRHYNDSHFAQVIFIKRAQALGFKLAELSKLKPSQNGFDWQHVGQLLQLKLQQTEQQIHQLTNQQTALKTMLQELELCPQTSSQIQDC